MIEYIQEFGNFSTENGDELLMSKTEYAVAAFVLLLIGIFGFFLNLLVIILMLRDKQLWTPLNIILFNLVCSDFSVSIFGNPWTFTSALYCKWIWGHVMCKVYGFFMSLLGINSITTLTVLAFERYVMVSRPFRSRNLSHQGAVFLVICIWLYSLILTLPPLFGWGKYVNESANISCSVNWEEQSTNAMSYICYLFAFGLLVPVLIITFSYVNIIYTMKKNSLKMGRVTKAEGRVAYIVFIMIIAFIIAWTPYALLSLWVQFGDASQITPAMGVIPALIAKSSICYNPIVYVGFNTQFRQSLRQIYRRRKNVNSTCETYAIGMSKYVDSQCQMNSKVETTFSNHIKTVETNADIGDFQESQTTETVNGGTVETKIVNNDNNRDDVL